MGGICSAVLLGPRAGREAISDGVLSIALPATGTHHVVHLLLAYARTNEQYLVSPCALKKLHKRDHSMHLIPQFAFPSSF